MFRDAAVLHPRRLCLSRPQSTARTRSRLSPRSAITLCKSIISVGCSICFCAPTIIKNLFSIPYHTNSTIYNLTVFPPRVVILSGGPICLEMAQAFSLLGGDGVLLPGMVCPPSPEGVPLRGEGRGT